jgi:hypothetical protein
MAAAGLLPHPVRPPVIKGFPGGQAPGAGTERACARNLRTFGLVLPSGMR